ncbi:MAG: YkgJ family cysteine cluster protein [Proteobacteria bacterium]|nr:YkgJ family cysteine cluster protein [Pseudomonadota bacterium]MBU1742889.1 YkgJ family cysteine cluster protein [Pseudomonadota bacterium]
MDDLLDPSNVPAPDRLGPDDTFRFDCRPDLPCFNRCCRDKMIPLWPLDVIYLKQALGLDSDAFLEQHGRIMPDPTNGWPIISLGLDPENVCPMVTDRGCRVYDHRPTACRLFPLAWAAKVTPQGKQDEFYYRLDAPACLGLQEKRDYTVAEWRQDQALADRQDDNERVETALFPAGRRGVEPPDPRQVQAVVMAAYNVDVFRGFVFKGGFLEKYEIEPGRLEQVRDDDLAALDLGLDWLAQVLHRRPALRPK